MTGAIAMGSQRITGLPSPASGSEPATKTYVDGEISSLSSTLTIAADSGS